ncbi:3-oxoadipate enol-lactonase [Pseudovibrio exalbescens]|uniref:3-oxoadipate enol-lactonase n=1 Tax=Pseudovibrio exalbescens TaxID=197461 RepID=UPI0023656850|nr:3-oxoadipate enol-lactonase [Pseudovibrio exalbescens]MDD7909261.1 3-oxoadipate enol-lactonase [Pseudovibrio exalbescens]
MEFIETNGVVLHCAIQRVEKGPPPLVFINSLGSDFRIWTGVCARLGDGWSTLRYDKRGHGLSEEGTDAYSIGRHADDLIGLLTKTGFDGVVLCGLSVGGLIALEIWRKRPDLVAGLVLCDTAAKIGTAQMWQDRIDLIRKDGIAALAEPVLERWFSSGFRSSCQEQVSGYRSMLVRTALDGYLGTCEAIRDADLTEVLQSITVPTLCLCGDEDGSTPPEVVMDMQEKISGSSFEMIEYAGHLPCVEQPDAIAQLLAQFVAKVHVQGQS